MAKVFIEESTLTAIGDAIRGKTGGSELIAPLDMADEISGIESGTGGEGGYEIPDEAFMISGNCQYRFANGGFDWFIELYGDKITTKDITDADNMFFDGNTTSIPFDFNFKNDTNYDYSYMFSNCMQLKEISGKFINMYPGNMSSMFNYCYRLRYLPEFINLNMERIYTFKTARLNSLFYNCYSLREIPEDLLNQLYNPLATSSSYVIFNSGFGYCYVLDEIKGLNPQTGTLTSNVFGNGFTYCSRVKDVTFTLQEDGTPYSANWKSQTIDLSNKVGYNDSLARITNYNSGITLDKRVTNDTNYQTLKNDPDWFTDYVDYSRYNKESALRTIQSLPDTSAYLASAGGTNTIKFKGAAGALTDGGAINTLTEEEISVAVNKGWTVTFV